MRRLTLAPRRNWQRKVESHGLTFHSPAALKPQTYWDESAAYQFTAAEVDTLEAAANELQTMCLAAAQHVIDKRRYAELAIPPAAIPLIEWSWEKEPPAIYGRFDLIWAGANSGSAPRLLEYNADTPTALIEAAVIQWEWMEDSRDVLKATLGHPPDQFNSIHDRLVAKWRDVSSSLEQPVYFAALEFATADGTFDKDAAEDHLTAAYLRDTAQQAGLTTHSIAIQKIGWNPLRQAFVDDSRDEHPIRSLFKLYPWESLLQERFGPAALALYRQMTWIEPIWKLLLSNKGLLPVLWQLYPQHPLLLPAFFESESRLDSYVRKPLHSREGHNLTFVENGSTTLATNGPYTGPWVHQAIAPEARFRARDGRPRYPVLGLWMIDQECGGLGIRESTGRITDNLSSFVPHFFG